MLIIRVDYHGTTVRAVHSSNDLHKPLPFIDKSNFYRQNKLIKIESHKNGEKNN